MVFFLLLLASRDISFVCRYLTLAAVGPPKGKRATHRPRMARNYL